MLQLNKSQTINTVAFYPNEVLPSGSGVWFSFTQSYSNTVTGSFPGDVISDPQNTSWIIATFSGSYLPSASGQYDFKMNELIFGEAIWNEAIDEWQLANTIWNEGISPVIGDQISVERAIISGSDVTPITEYVSMNENARYKVYLG